MLCAFRKGCNLFAAHHAEIMHFFQFPSLLQLWSGEFLPLFFAEILELDDDVILEVFLADAAEAVDGPPVVVHQAILQMFVNFLLDFRGSFRRSSMTFV